MSTSPENLSLSTQTSKTSCDGYGSVYSIFITMLLMYNYLMCEDMLQLQFSVLRRGNLIRQIANTAKTSAMGVGERPTFVFPRESRAARSNNVARWQRLEDASLR